MLTLATTVLLFNAACLTAVLVASKVSVRLVDDANRPIDRSSDWQERLVPVAERASKPNTIKL